MYGTMYVYKTSVGIYSTVLHTFVVTVVCGCIPGTVFTSVCMVSAVSSHLLTLFPLTGAFLNQEEGEEEENSRSRAAW